MREAQRRKAKISAFALAKDLGVICAEVGIHDVLHMRPDWSHEQAKAFLDRNSSAIGEVMLIGALQVMKQLLEGGDDYVQ